MFLGTPIQGSEYVQWLARVTQNDQPLLQSLKLRSTNRDSLPRNFWSSYQVSRFVCFHERDSSAYGPYGVVRVQVSYSE